MLPHKYIKTILGEYQGRKRSLGCSPRKIVFFSQILKNPWISISEKFTSGKVVKGEIIKILDKGIIFKLEDGLEGIVPLKRIGKNEKQQLLMSFKEGDTHNVTVQEVDAESKKKSKQKTN